MTQDIWNTPLVCSQGGIPYNLAHIEYWKTQAKISYGDILKHKAEIARLSQVLSTVPCPAGGWTGMPKELEGNCTVADCLKDKSCGCTFGGALTPQQGEGPR